MELSYENIDTHEQIYNYLARSGNMIPDQVPASLVKSILSAPGSPEQTERRRQELEPYPALRDFEEDIMLMPEFIGATFNEIINAKSILSQGLSVLATNIENNSNDRAFKRESITLGAIRGVSESSILYGKRVARIAHIVFGIESITAESEAL